MAIVTGPDVLKELCRAFGVDTRVRMITGITVVADVNDVARVEVREVANVGDSGVPVMEEFATRYELVPAGGAPPAAGCVSLGEWNPKFGSYAELARRRMATLDKDQPVPSIDPFMGVVSLESGADEPAVVTQQ
jgi:hypothetical protein